MAAIFTVIGDVVGSRRLPSRSDSHAALTVALRQAAAAVPPVDRLETTVGDEFQGVFGTFAEACLAPLLIRLRLAAAGTGMDVRCGIGAGERQILDGERTPMVQDGPAWWSARAALDVLGTPTGRLRRTWYDGDLAAGDAGPPAALANAFLVSRDALVDRLNPRSRDMLLLSLGGESQRAIAQTLQVSASAVSQAFAKGVGAVRDAQAMLSTLPHRS